MRIRNNIIYGLTFYLKILPAPRPALPPSSSDYEVLLLNSGIFDTVKNYHRNTQGILAISV